MISAITLPVTTVASALHEDLVPDEVEYHSASSELRELILSELILSGELDE